MLSVLACPVQETFKVCSMKTITALSYIQVYYTPWYIDGNAVFIHGHKKTDHFNKFVFFYIKSLDRFGGTHL